ncbi:MAG: RNA polymerase sigma factor, partial [Henriciella sp.]
MSAKLIRFPGGEALPELSDPDLAALAVKGDRKAFAELVRRHQGKVRGMLRRLSGSPSDGDDLAQQTFVTAWEKLSSYAGGRFQSWLCAIAYRQFLQAARKRKFEVPLEAATEQAVSEGPVGLKQDLDAALNALTDPQRLCVVLCTATGLTHAEAAR